MLPQLRNERTELMHLATCTRILRLALFAVLAALMVSGPIAAQAQGLFSPARKVNDRVITNFDIEQRILFMELLNVGAADMRAEAMARLTEEAVQEEAARRMGVRLTSEELADGMTEFASRVEMDTETFVATIAQAGVARESFEAFVRAGLLWRKIVAERYPALIDVSGNDAARTLDVSAIRGSQRVLMSEIFLPMDPQFAEAVAQIMQMIEEARTIEEFSAIAREFSLAGSRDAGGRLDWLPIENLPPQIAGRVSSARPGQIIGPLELGGAIAYFQLRALDSVRNIPAEQVKVTYARLLLPGGRSEANLAQVAQIRDTARVCADLGPFARDLPDSALTERTEFLRAIPQSDAVELSRLDRGEISANTLDGGNMVVLMLCARELDRPEGPTREQQRSVLFDQQLAALADVQLKKLIADADIRDF